MQQDGTVIFERVTQRSPLETWHVVAALLLFAAIIYAVLRSRRQAEKNDWTLNLRK